jgi:hypothetical protein
MKRLALLTLTAAFAAILVPAAVLAKGASEAQISGPGLGTPIKLAGEGQAGGGQLMQLAEAAGFFPSVFATVPNPMLDARPQGDLGPRYTITYVMPGPGSVADRIRQDLYPYAKPSPVTHTDPGQPFFGTERTVGGWYVASSVLKDDLVAAGLPETPPAGGGSDFPWTVLVVLAVATSAAVVAAFIALLVRRRPRPATA